MERKGAGRCDVTLYALVLDTHTPPHSCLKKKSFQFQNESTLAVRNQLPPPPPLRCDVMVDRPKFYFIYWLVFDANCKYLHKFKFLSAPMIERSNETLVRR